MPPLELVSDTLPVTALTAPVLVMLLAPARPVVILICPPLVVALAMPRPVDSLTVSDAEVLPVPIRPAVALSVWIDVLTETLSRACTFSTFPVNCDAAPLRVIDPLALKIVMSAEPAVPEEIVPAPVTSPVPSVPALMTMAPFPVVVRPGAAMARPFASVTVRF